MKKFFFLLIFAFAAFGTNKTVANPATLSLFATTAAHSAVSSVRPSYTSLPTPGTEAKAAKKPFLKQVRDFFSGLLAEDGKIASVIGYLGPLGFLIGLILHLNNKTPFAAYHLRQSLGNIILLFIGYLFAIIFAYILPFVGYISWVFYILYLVNIIVGLINAVSSKTAPVPIFGKLFEGWFSFLN